MAKMVWAETELLPGRPQLFTEAQFKIHSTNGWVEIDPPDVDPDAKQPAKTVTERPSSDKKPASEIMTERSPSDKKPASLQAVIEEALLQAVIKEATVKEPTKSSPKKKKTTTKSSTTKK